MMSSGKARPENAEFERRVKRRPQRLQRKRWPPSCVVPSLVATSELQRGHVIDASSCAPAMRPTSLQENRLLRWPIAGLRRLVSGGVSRTSCVQQLRRHDGCIGRKHLGQVSVVRSNSSLLQAPSPRCRKTAPTAARTPGEDSEVLVLRMDWAKREALLPGEAGAFFLMPHYRSYPAVLVSLGTVARRRAPGAARHGTGFRAGTLPPRRAGSGTTSEQVRLIDEHPAGRSDGCLDN